MSGIRTTQDPDRADFGVDRLSLSFPVRAAVRQGWSTQTRRETKRGEEVASSMLVDLNRGVSAFVGVLEVEGKTWGKVEANPARMVDPDGCSLAPLVAIPTLARQMWEAATEVAAPACTLPEARMKRLDVARDFREVGSPSLYVRSLQGVRRTYAKRAYVFSNPARGLAETLAVGSGSGMARLYDQHEAYADKGAPEGSLRWELEARDRWLERVDLRHFGDWKAESVEELVAKRWDWSGCGLEVTATDAVIERVLRADLSPAKRERLLGRLLLQAQGFPVGGGRQVGHEYNALIRSLGVVLQVDGDGGGASPGDFVGRLDFETGREVLRAA